MKWRGTVRTQTAGNSDRYRETERPKTGSVRDSKRDRQTHRQTDTHRCLIRIIYHGIVDDSRSRATDEEGNQTQLL